MLLSFPKSEGRHIDLCSSSSDEVGTVRHAEPGATVDRDPAEAERREIADRVQQLFESRGEYFSEADIDSITDLLIGYRDRLVSQNRWPTVRAGNLSNLPS